MEGLNGVFSSLVPIVYDLQRRKHESSETETLLQNIKKNEKIIITNIPESLLLNEFNQFNLIA